MEYWGVNLRLDRSSGIDFAFPAGFQSLPVAAFRADNALAALEQYRAKPALVCRGDECRPSLAGKQGCKYFTSDFGLYLVGELGEAFLMVGWQ